MAELPTINAAHVVSSIGSTKLLPRTLQEWLAWQSYLHKKPIELGLERVGKVAERLALTNPRHAVITVAGTNGKGSCVAMLESILVAAGYRVGSYTSPHLLRYNERVRIRGQEVTDAALCDAFARVERAREAISLSYFEFGTLAAMCLFEDANLDVSLMEVGLGGRLDAVNVQDTDLAVITSIGLDHTEWLGLDRESIGYEKSGIMRGNAPAVCGDPDPPNSVIERAKALQSLPYFLGRDFRYRNCGATWAWEGPQVVWTDLPRPGLQGEVQLRNASTVLMCLHALRDRFAVDRQTVHQGLRTVQLLGRFQRLQTPVETFVDLAHTPDAVRVLAENLRNRANRGNTHVVFAVLADKDAGAMAGALIDIADYWYVAELQTERTLSCVELSAIVKNKAPHVRVDSFTTVTEAYAAAAAAASPIDRIVVFGSTLCVAEILQACPTWMR